MQCILCKIYFWKVFHKYYNFICTPICTKFLFLQKVGVTPDKFKTANIDRYDGSSNPEEFIQVYQIVIKATGGDDRVNANFLPTVLAGAARSWLINLLDGSVTSWDQLCSMFIGNF
jgi:hypothetical protein